MENRKNLLSSVERKVVLSSLTNGRITLTIESDYGIPAKIEAEKIKVLEDGLIFIPRPTSEIAAFAGEDVTISFEWNEVPVTFRAHAFRMRSGLSFSVPEEMTRGFVEEKEKKEEKRGILATLFFDRKEMKEGIEVKSKKSVDCTVALEKKEKIDGEDSLLLKWNANANDERITQCARFLLSVEKKFKIPSLVFLDSTQLSIAVPEFKIFPINLGDEREIEVSFPLPKPLKSRKMLLSFIATRILRGNADDFFVLGKFSGVCMEDLRFLHDHFQKNAQIKTNVENYHSKILEIGENFLNPKSEIL